MYVRKQKKIVIIAIISMFLLCGVNTASGHFNFFLPEEWSMNKAEENSIDIIWGHPYEGIYFDAPAMTNCSVLTPDGAINILPSTEMTVSGTEGPAKGIKVSLTPDLKGDYIVYADFEALVVEEEEVAWEDHVKAIFHYKTSGGWDQQTGQIMEIVPLTRPYGLEAGFIFTGQALYDGQPLPGAPVEVEKYYAVGVCTEENLPDEPLVTRETTTDPNGIFSFTLDEPGIWVVCVSNTVGTKEGYDKDIRGILMINIEEELSLLQTDSDPTNIEEFENEDESDDSIVVITLVVSILAFLMATVVLVKGRKKQT